MLKRFEQQNGRGKVREFMSLLRNRGEKLLESDLLRSKLDSLVMGGNFESYLEKFYTLTNQIDDMNDVDLLYMFKNDLNLDTRNQLSTANIETLDQAIEVATRFEANKRKLRGPDNNIMRELNYTKKSEPQANSTRTFQKKEEVKEKKAMVGMIKI